MHDLYETSIIDKDGMMKNNQNKYKLATNTISRKKSIIIKSFRQSSFSWTTFYYYLLDFFDYYELVVRVMNSDQRLLMILSLFFHSALETFIIIYFTRNLTI